MILENSFFAIKKDRTQGTIFSQLMYQAMRPLPINARDDGGRTAGRNA